MKVRVNSEGWTLNPATATRAAGAAAPGVPPEFLTEASDTEEFVAQPAPSVRGAGTAPATLDITADLGPGETAVLALRHASGALTFHAPRSTNRTRGGPVEVRFIVPVRLDVSAPESGSRGLVSKAVKAVVIKFADAAVGAGARLLMPKLALAFETQVWKRKGLREGWLKVTKEGLASGQLAAGKPTSTERTLLLVHGTFSNAAAAYGPLARSTFFDEVEPLYGDRVFAFDHFTVSRTPEENAAALLQQLPDKTFTFDVITHSRGGLVLRNLVERSSAFQGLGRRFNLGRAVLVAAPNEGTPLATPARWEETLGWIANLLELFPENPFTTGPEFIANGLQWLAQHVLGNLPGLHSMDADGELIRELQSPPPPPADRYSVLVANYTPTGSVMKRLLDVGVDQFFNTANDLVVPSEGGWRVDSSGGTFVPGSRIGCFGPGGNIDRDDVTHVNFFEQPETVAFLVAALSDQPHALEPVDPAERLPDRRLIRAGGAGVSAPAIAAARQPALARRARIIGAGARPAESEAGLTVTVVNGDLTFEERPLLVGHYRATRLTGTEWVIDKLLDRAMSNALHLGVYPAAPGTNRIFNNRRVAPGRLWQSPRPAAVIVAGLGQEGQLQSADLIHTVRQAVLSWAERVAERGRPLSALRVASTLIGSGGTGVTPGQAAQLIAQGVFEANEVIRRASPRQRLPEVSELRLIELYLSRATEAWEALKMLAAATPTRYRVNEPIVSGLGWLPRPLESGYRGAEYDFITAETHTDADGNTAIAYALDTTRARTEVRAQATQHRLLRELVASASSEQNADPQIGRTLYNLLVPLELEAFLAGSGETQIEVDAGTAGIPWEMLDDATAAQPARMPWAIRSKLLRKYRTETFRPQVSDADSQASVLVIGEPRCPPDYAPLPGALQEAKDVFTLLTSTRGLDADRVKGLFAGGEVQEGPEARQVVDALFERSWRIVHIAGHGEAVDEKRHRGGVVLSNDTFLGAAEIKAMRVVPELVFVNCCHLGAGGRSSLLNQRYDRAQFASSVAQALIEIGVRCVVAAGWAVDDAAASAFATTFYDALLRGQRFIDAVAEARARALESGGNTWAAYQCYGDPDWVFTRTKKVKGAAQPRADEFDYIASLPALELALDTIIVQSTYQGADAESQRARIRTLEERFQRMKWTATVEVAERFARAFAAANDVPSAIRWYEAAIAQADGHVSFRILEQVSNLRTRQALQEVWAAEAEFERAAAAPPEGGAQKRGRGKPSTKTRRRGRARKQLDAARAKARDVIREELRALEQLTAFEKTTERESLTGAALKRLAMLERSAGRAVAMRTALKGMEAAYRRALDLARERGAPNLFYPATNLLAAELALKAGTRGLQGLSPELFAEAERSAREKNLSNPDFWSLVAEPELRLYQAVAGGTLPKQRGAVERAFRDVQKRSQSASQWKSVADTAHFVLDGYVKRVAGQASTAAAEVLRMLDEFAHASPGGS